MNARVTFGAAAYVSCAVIAPVVVDGSVGRTGELRLTWSAPW